MKEQLLYGNCLSNGEYIPSAETPRLLFRSSESRGEIFGIDEPTVFRHVLYVGGSGWGKTNAMFQVYYQLKYAPDVKDSVIVVFDTKADYHDHRHFCTAGDIVIGNSKRFRDKSAVWNIFEEVLADGDHPKDYESNAMEIAKGLFKGRGSKSQPFFAEAATIIFASTIIYFIRRYRDNYEKWHDKLNNQYLCRFLTGYTAEQLAGFFGLYSDMRGLKTYFGDGNNNQALGVFAELRGMLDACFRGVFAQEPPRGSKGFSIRKAIREKKGKSIFIEYDLATGEALLPVYSVLVDLALKEAMGESANGKTYLLLDELKLLPTLSHLDDAINFGRSKKVSVIAGLQSVNQIYATYGEALGQSILGGFGSVIAFRTPDHTSREYISKLFGPNVVSYRYYDPNHDPVDRERDGYTVEHWDVQNLEIGQAIVGLASQKSPFLFRFSKDPYR
ncbi:MAG: type IV secretion system DNA-binding domain-containing protein [Clostridia bacterium]|nr:type IV secretion system DNA-binding domain-containing protein [Clostridia bacterium]